MKYLKYLKSLLVHKFYFFVYGLFYGVSVDLLFTHDISKFLPSEFFPYARYFYGTFPKRAEIDEDKLLTTYSHEDAGIDMNFAWMEHQHRNKHHWQYYVQIDDNGDVLYHMMPERYLRELIADWRAANKAYGTMPIWEWYESNKEEQRIHHLTVEQIEMYIETARDWDARQKIVWDWKTVIRAFTEKIASVSPEEKYNTEDEPHVVGYRTLVQEFFYDWRHFQLYIALYNFNFMYNEFYNGVGK